MNSKGIGRNASFRKLRIFQLIQSLLSLAGVKLSLNFVPTFTNFDQISQLCAAWLKTAVAPRLLGGFGGPSDINTQFTNGASCVQLARVKRLLSSFEVTLRAKMRLIQP
jgi:hypothetical protein